MCCHHQYCPQKHGGGKRWCVSNKQSLKYVVWKIQWIIRWSLSGKGSNSLWHHSQPYRIHTYVFIFECVWVVFTRNLDLTVSKLFLFERYFLGQVFERKQTRWKRILEPFDHACNFWAKTTAISEKKPIGAKNSQNQRFENLLLPRQCCCLFLACLFLSLNFANLWLPLCLSIWERLFLSSSLQQVANAFGWSKIKSFFGKTNICDLLFFSQNEKKLKHLSVLFFFSCHNHSLKKQDGAQQHVNARKRLWEKNSQRTSDKTLILTIFRAKHENAWKRLEKTRTHKVLSTKRWFWPFLVPNTKLREKDLKKNNSQTTSEKTLTLTIFRAKQNTLFLLGNFILSVFQNFKKAFFSFAFLCDETCIFGLFLRKVELFFSI